jgi:DNA mismatch repair protein MutS
MLANPQATIRLLTALRATPDLARALGRLSLNRGGPRDLAAVRDTLTAAREAAAALDGPLPEALAAAHALLAEELPVLAMLTEALTDPAPLRVDDGGAIKPGYDGELDAHRSLRDDSRRVLASMQLDYAQKFGVASLKIRHHAQLGYVIEAPAAAVESLRAFPELTLRQGMASGARFTESGLSDLDRRITEAADRAAAREKRVVSHLTEATLAVADALAARADALALLDVADAIPWWRTRSPVTLLSCQTPAICHPSGACCC